MTESSKPPSGRRMKAHAPPPPQVPQPAPRHIFRSSTPDGGGTAGMDTKENILRPTVDLRLTLPHGHQTSVIEDGSKALMDLLVELCSRYHLNPALHTLELLSPEGQPVAFKPNALLGSLDVASVLIREKVWEERAARRPAPKVPEKSVRLMVNFHGSQKAVVRVNPLVPLQTLIPAICDKCEFEPAHVLLLKDSISRHELPLDKSLAELGIKELYVHDQSLVLQPKMASAPALNYTDSIYSSTSSLGRPGKKGFLGIFQFSRRKSKTESTSKDMDDCDDKISQNTDTRSDALSTVSGNQYIEERTVPLGQSQSVSTLPRMSPKAETKKRRAPAPPGAPTPSMGHASYESFQISLGSESQQRKRKAPAPPPTPTSITQGSDEASAAPTPDSCDTEPPTPALFTRVAQVVSSGSAPIVVTQTAKQAPLRVVVQPLCDDGPSRGSPTPSSSTADSLTVQDSSSELSHSIDDSDADLDQAGSRCSTLTSSSASGCVQVQTSTARSSAKVEESTSAATASDSSSRSETESALNLKLEEVENNRHSAIGNTDRPVPPKPRRSLIREPLLPVKPPTLPTLHSSFPPIESTVSSPPQNFMETGEASPQSWLHTMRSSATTAQKPVSEAPEEETVSLGGSSSSSNSSSLPDQGYAASEGMAEGEDSGMVSSPSDTQPTSPEGSLSLNGSSRERGEKLRGPPRDSSSDSDEGCATWGSIHRHKDISQQAESARLKDSYEDDHELTTQLHQTLADFEADLADRAEVISAKDAPYTMSRGSNEVPVSVVDMDVPVTAIDEVLEEYERHIVQHESKSLTWTQSASCKGSDLNHKSNVEPQNKNNNAYTTAVSDKKSIANSKQSSQVKQHSKQQESKFISLEKEEKHIETKMKKTAVTDATRVKKDKPSPAAKSDVDMSGKSAEVFSERRADAPPQSQRSVSAKRDEDTSKVYQNNSSLSAAQGKITRNVTSRFGMKTFTVVPPKPTVVHDASEQPAVRSTTGAIRIDDQGNMVTAGIAWNQSGASPASQINSSKDSPLLGKAKAFWSSNERQESVHKSPAEMESKSSLTSDSIALVEAQKKTSSMEQFKTTQSALSKTPERIQPDKVVKEECDDPEAEVTVSNQEQVEVQSKISKSFQLPSNKPVLPPPVLPDLKRDLSFLKPSRRTSSQYVASAINKYTPKSSAKPPGSPKTPDYSSGFQRSGRSIQVNPHQSSQSFFSDNKENVSIFTSNPPGPKRSMSYPEYVSDSRGDLGGERRDTGGFKNEVVSTKETLDRLETERVHSNHVQSSVTKQITVTTRSEGENLTHSRLRPRSPSPATVRPFHSSTKPPTAPKIIFKAQTNSSTDTTETATHLSSNTRQQPSVTVSDSGVTPGPPAVTLFGPITKFRPVIHKAVEKETSLHSSLMEAIQTGGGRDRLKKISTSGPSSMEKVSCVEEENERSALLAAIRAQSSSGRLRKTKSEAADELEKFRKVASEEEERNLGPSSSSPSSPSLTCTSPVFNPPPPPPASTVAPPPPPPPPVLPQAKPSSAARPNADASMNPALAREAMLQAIRSGSAAEKLKKVAAPTKTLQVNGRLGTIQPTSSTSIPQ